MKVKIVYRNYKPLHKAYESLVANPPEGVQYIVPPVKSGLGKLMPIYRKLRYFRLGRYIIRVVERVAFNKPGSDEDIDLYHYLNMISDEVPDKPYIIDFEHASSMTGFSYDEDSLDKVYKFISSEQCISINCWTEAARRTLKNLLADRYGAIEQKVNVVYPALKNIEPADKRPDYKFVKDNDKLKLLFVGTPCYVKGLEEVLWSIRKINEIYPEKVDLYVVSGDAEEICGEYDLPNVKVYEPNFSKQQIVSLFFAPTDLFVMPTKQDTFGMVFLDALNCGKPIITTKQFATPEIIDAGKDGFLVELTNPLLDSVVVPGKEDDIKVKSRNLDKALAKEICDLIEKLIAEKVDLKKMGANGAKKFIPGAKFSVEVRNKKLLDIYKKALEPRSPK